RIQKTIQYSSEKSLHPRTRITPKPVRGDRTSRRVSLCPRGLPDNVPGTTVDDAHVLRIRNPGRHKQTSTLLAGTWRNGSEHCLRHANALRVRPRQSAG